MLATLRAVTLILAAAAAAQSFAASDWDDVEAVLGRNAAVQPGGVHRFGFPRTDLQVEVDGVPIEPAFALGSWLAFKDVGDHSLVMGDLVLLENEVGPVMTRLADAGIEITALHNHLLRARPFPMYMHVKGEGDAVALARTLRAALEASDTPFDSTAAGTPRSRGSLDTDALDRIVGFVGSANGAVYHFGIPRADNVETRVSDDDDLEDEDEEYESDDYTTVPPSMGTAIGINFEPTGASEAAITGDFVLRPSEVNPVLRALKDNDIEVTALHTHMLDERPHVLFMHFWANDDPEKLARGLAAALDHIDLRR